MKIKSHPMLFILGVERCGSTWLSNIFDSSPDVLFFMEPFASFAEIFPGFPNRLAYLPDKSRHLEDILIRGFGDLYGYKYPLFDGHDKTLFLRSLSRWLIRGHDRMLRPLRGRPSLKSIRYNLLNLHQSESGETAIYKKRNPSITVTKELRLNFKIGVLRGVFPHAKYVVVVRNPVAQLNSIMRLFSRGSLGQLKLETYSFLECITACDRFRKYHEVLRVLDADSIFDRLVAYWFINYNTLIEDLLALNCDYTVVSHEELSENTEAVVEELFGYSGCRYTDSTKQYIAGSSSFDNQAVSPVDTRRNSKKSYKEALRGGEQNIGTAFRKSSLGFWEISTKEIQEYEAQIKSPDSA